MEHRMTARNGIAISLGHLGKEEEAIALFCQELKQTDLSQTGRYSLTVNLCNRFIMFHRDTLQKQDEVFTKILDMLEQLVNGYQLGHEEKGGDILYLWDVAYDG